MFQPAENKGNIEVKVQLDFKAMRKELEETKVKKKPIELCDHKTLPYYNEYTMQS